MTDFDERPAATDLADRQWRFVSEESRDGTTNMALDEVAAHTAAAGGPRTIRVYRWEPSTLTLGYRQAPETVDWAFCDREGIGVTRRPTGGGGIYHDEYGDISYSIVAPAEELPGDLMETYELLCEPILDAFAELGIDAGFAAESREAAHQPACYLREVNPAHDVVVTDDRGERKISGNAQYRRRDAVVQHGSLKFDLDAKRHLGVFADPDTTTREFGDRVTTIREEADVDRETAVRTLEETLANWAGADEGDWSDEELDAARDRAERKYATDEWTKRRHDPLQRP